MFLFRLVQVNLVKRRHEMLGGGTQTYKNPSCIQYSTILINIFSCCIVFLSFCIFLCVLLELLYVDILHSHGCSIALLVILPSCCWALLVGVPLCYWWLLLHIVGPSHCLLLYFKSCCFIALLMSFQHHVAQLLFSCHITSFTSLHCKFFHHIISFAPSCC